MKILPLEAIIPDLKLIASNDSFFGTVKKDYVDFRESGFFIATEDPAFFIHQIHTSQRTHTGIICCASIEDYLNNSIRKHENTLDVMEQQQLQLTIHRKSVVKPVLLTYPEQESISKLIQEFILGNPDPMMSIQFDDPAPQQHQVWSITGAKWLKKLQSLFQKNVPIAYIADGHHRTKVMSLLHDRKLSKKIDLECHQFLAAFFPENELDVWEYNRVFETEGELSAAHFIALLSSKMEITPLNTPQRPLKKHTMTIFLDGEWYKLRWRKRVLKKYQDDLVLLDVKLLNEELFKPLFNVTNVRTDRRIKYVSGTRGWEGIRELVAKGPDRIGFCMYPLQLQELMQIADAGLELPPKSTWFEPRMRNGIIVQEL